MTELQVAETSNKFHHLLDTPMGPINDTYFALWCYRLSWYIEEPKEKIFNKIGGSVVAWEEKKKDVNCSAMTGNRRELQQLQFWHSLTFQLIHAQRSWKFPKCLSPRVHRKCCLLAINCSLMLKCHHAPYKWEHRTTNNTAQERRANRYHITTTYFEDELSERGERPLLQDQDTFPLWRKETK